MSFCCTCALPLSDIKVPYSAETEKPLTFTRTLDCCGRTICASCQYTNPRFETYCPFCQISSEPGSALPQAGLRLPPAYDKQDVGHATRNNLSRSDSPPSYSAATATVMGSASTSNEPLLSGTSDEDVLHHLQAEDTVQSISLLYRVPADILRSHNSIFSDHLLLGRRVILIPRSHYSGPSLSHPPDPQEEERKMKIRRWMVATKCADYDVAGLYLKGSDFDLDLAIDAYKSDEQWEREHPMEQHNKRKGTSRQSTAGPSLTGQLR